MINQELDIQYVYTAKKRKAITGFTIIGTYADCRNDVIYHNILFGISRIKLNKSIVKMLADNNIVEINIFNKDREHIWVWQIGRGCRELSPKNVVATKPKPALKMLLDRDIKGETKKIIYKKLLKGVAGNVPKIETRRDKRKNCQMWSYSEWG